MTVTKPAALELEQTGAFRVDPPPRQRVADQVFERLSRAILRGEIKPGEPLPTQRDLARQFSISPLVVRQAIHRLEDLGLVRVKQGSTTLVLDPAKATDIRVIQLQMELADSGDRLALDAYENQLLFVMPMLLLAERRATPEERAQLKALVDAASESVLQGEALRRFLMRFWALVAQATRNVVFQQQMRWWGSMAADLEQRGRSRRMPVSRPAPIEFYRKLADALTRGEGSVELFMAETRPMLDAFERLRESVTQGPDGPLDAEHPTDRSRGSD